MKTTWNSEAFALALHHNLESYDSIKREANAPAHPAFLVSLASLVWKKNSPARQICLYRLFLEQAIHHHATTGISLWNTLHSTARYSALMEQLVRLFMHQRFPSGDTGAISSLSLYHLYRLAHTDAARLADFLAADPHKHFVLCAFAEALEIPHLLADSLFWAVDTMFPYASALTQHTLTAETAGGFVASALSPLQQRYVLEAAYQQLHPIMGALLRRLSSLEPSPSLLRDTLQEALLPLAVDYQALVADVVSPLHLPPIPDMDLAKLLEEVEPLYEKRSHTSSRLLSSLQHALDDTHFSAAARYQAILPQLPEAHTAPSLSLGDKISSDASSVAKEAGKSILAFFKNLQRAAATEPAAEAPVSASGHTPRTLDPSTMHYEVSVAGEPWHATSFRDVESYVKLGRRIIFMTHHQAQHFIKLSLRYQQHEGSPSFELGLVHYWQKGQIIPFSQTAHPLPSDVMPH